MNEPKKITRYNLVNDLTYVRACVAVWFIAFSSGINFPLFLVLFRVRDFHCIHLYPKPYRNVLCDR